MEYPLVTADINLAAIDFNIRALKNITHPDSKFMAVVKADAYGHGAVMVAKTAVKSGAHWLGVARIEEAIELRNAGLDTPILIFGYIHPNHARTISDLNLTATVFDLDMAMALSESATACCKPIKIHLKVDTGMGRIGIIAKENSQILNEIVTISKLPNIHVQGIYTHFACADTPDKTYTEKQIKTFTALLSDLKQTGLEFEFCHAANSAGIINFPQSHFDMVRTGIAIYGCYPSNQKETSKITLKPAMTLKSIISSVKEVPKGFHVSYGMTHKTDKKTCLASVPIGYADGFSRNFSSNGFMLVKGEKAPIVGRVCMDQTMIDIGKIADVKPGDEVIILGTQGNKNQTAEELSQRINTINYEIVSAITARIKLTYTDSAPGSSSAPESGSG